MNKHKTFLALAAALACLALTATSANAALVGFGTNLIENGNFENSAAVAGYSSGAGVAIAGWEDGATYGATTAGSTATDSRPLTYANDSGQEFVSNTASTSLYPGPTSGPLAALGNNFIYSNDAGAGTSGMSQTIDLTGNAAVMNAILAGSANYDFNGYFGGWDTQPDQINLEASFRNAANTEVGSVLIGSVIPGDRGNNRDAFVYRSAAGTLPTSTESIVFTWISGPSISGGQSGVADNVSFSIGIDTTPAWVATWPQVDGVSASGATARARIDEDGMAYFVVVADGASAPSSTEVKAGTGAGGASAIASGSIALTNDVEGTAAIGGLAAGTGYDVYFVAEDDELIPSLQATPVEVGISTPSFDSWGGGATSGGDANGDGVTNSLAFLLGAADPNENATARLPTGSGDGSGGLVLIFDCLPVAARGGLALRVAHSSDLGVSDAWSATPVVPDASGGPFNGVTFVVDTVSAAPLNRVTATIGAAEAAGGRLFGRLEGPIGLVFRTQLSTYTTRDLEYHLDTGDLYLIGEQTHGLDYNNSSGNNFWWCGLNNGGSGLLDFLMDNNPNAAAMKATATGNGWSGFTGSQYGFLNFKPLAAQRTFVNHTSGETAYPPEDYPANPPYDYDQIASADLLLTIYRNDSGSSYFGLGGPSLDAVLAAAVLSLPPGDGSANRDNGVRYDIAWKTNIQLTEEQKLELLNQFTPVNPLYDDSAKAYFIDHPSGL